jgi:hypothetical protein
VRGVYVLEIYCVSGFEVAGMVDSKGTDDAGGNSRRTRSSSSRGLHSRRRRYNQVVVIIIVKPFYSLYVAIRIGCIEGCMNHFDPESDEEWCPGP